MGKLNFHSIKSRLTVGYGVMAVLLIVVVAITLIQIGQILVLGVDVLTNKQPSRLHLQKFTHGISESNVATQSFLLSGDESFNEKRENIWKNEVYIAKDSIDSLLSTWENPENIIDYEKIVRLSERIQKTQSNIINQASFSTEAPSVSLYSYENISGDTIIGVDQLQSWINQSLSASNSSSSNDNGSMYITELMPLNNELIALSNKLYDSLKEEAEEVADEIYAERTSFIIVESIIVIGSILLCFALFRFVLGKVLNSIQLVKSEISTLSAGNIPEEKYHTKDELNIILQEINSLSDNLADVKTFALEVGKGSFDNDITVFNNEGEIGNSLAEMRDSLKKVSEEAVIRNWSNKGFAEFGDILRRHSSDLASLSDEVITYMVNYLGANQGSLFIVDESESGSELLKLSATYAYDRKKFLEKTIEKGQGLVGQAFIERQSIYLKEIPEDYITITSGLGKATPNSIFITPLIVNEEVYGVIELGSFHEFKEHERKFIEEVAENIASSIQSVKVNERTNTLLEESQQMTEEMRAQEEEMRQNMEELQATQEEMERNQRENSNRLNAIENSKMSYIEFEPNGKIIHADPSFLNLFGYQADEIEGKHHRIFVHDEYAQSNDYKEFWKRLAQGENISGEFKRVSKSGEDVYIFGAYSAVIDDSGQVTKVMKFAHDITQLKKDVINSVAEKESLLKTIDELKAQIDSEQPASSASKTELKEYQEKLSKDLKATLAKNESALKKSIEQQKKDLGL